MAETGSPRRPRANAFVALWLLLIGFLLILGGAMGWNLYNEHAAIDAGERARLAHQAEVIDKNISQQLLATHGALHSLLAELPYLKAQTNGHGQVNRRLKSMSDALTGVRTLVILDADGTAVASNREELIGRNFREREYVQAARRSGNAGVLHLSPPYKTSLGVFAMNLTKVILNERGEFAGLIVATLDPDYFTTLLDSILYAPDMWTGLVHGDGAVSLVVPSRSGVEGHDLAKPGSFFTRHRDSGQKQSVMTGISVDSGDQLMMAQRTVKPENLNMDKALVVAVARNLQGMFAPWRQDATREGGLYALLVFASCLGMVLYQRRQRYFDRMAADQEVEQQRRMDQYRSIVQASLDGFWVTDGHSRILEANESACRMLGYSREELLGLSIADIEADESQEKIGARIRQMIETGHVQFEARHRRKDGTLIDVEVSVQYIAALGEQFFAFVRDVTGRKRAEIALRENSALLESLINSSADFIFIKDRDLRTILCNKVFAQALGKAPQELYGKTDIENGWSADLVLGCPDQGIRGFQQDDLAALSGQTVHSRADLGNVGSDIRVFDSLKVPLRSSGGEIIGMLGISRDVTELRRTEEQVEELNRNFVAFLENTTDFIYFKDQDSRFRFCSQTLADITGHANWRDMIGKHDLEVFPQDTAQIYHEEELPIFRDGVPLLNKIDPYYDAAGNIGWVNTNKWPLKDGDGKVVGLFGISRDISKFKRTEDSLRKSEARFRAYFERSMVGIAETSPEKGWVEVNDRMCEILGVAREELIRKTWAELTHPDDLAADVAQFNRVLAGEIDGYAMDKRFIHGDGHVVFTHLAVRCVRKEDGTADYFVALVDDVSARKQAEAEILRSNAELEQFSYAISHDMRQPLRMISSYMQLLENGLAGQLDAEKREFFDFAIDGAKRLDAMLVGLLDYSRVGRKGEPPAMIESRDILDQALLFLGPAMVEAQSDVHIEGDWPRVYVRQDEILRLLQNLIGNALKYRVKGRQPQITVTSEVLPEEWRVRITDNGVGIIPGQIDRLFQVFQRLQSRADYEGTGIGLALCRKIVEHHGGKIWAESAGEGTGSRFTFSIPGTSPLTEAK